MLHPSHLFLPLNRRRFLTGCQSAPARHLHLVFAIAVLGVCVISPQAHAEISVPAAISDSYSDVNMHVQLAISRNVGAPCVAGECALNKEFDQRVRSIGAHLSDIAFKAYPSLAKRIERFEFVVAEKKEAGTLSNASGTIVVFRGVQELELEDQALAFLMAREAGRIIGGHHDVNTGTSILLSVLATMFFPVTGILQGLNSAALANATSSTVASTAASSATSLLGSRMVLAGIKPKQLREADAIAMRLLKPLGWSENDIASSLESCTHIDGQDAWAKDFRFSAEHVRTLVPEEGTALASAAPLVTRAAQDNLGQAPAASGLVAIESKPQVKVQAQNQTKIQGSALALKSEPSQDSSEVSKPALVVAEQAPEIAKVAKITPQATAGLVTAAKDTEIIAKNEVSASPDITAKGDATMLGAKIPEGGVLAYVEEQEALIEDGANDTLTEEPQLPDALSHQVAKSNMQGVKAEKITPRAGLNRNGSKVAIKTATKTATKVVSGNTKQKLAKATASGKQTATKKSYASNSSKTKLATNTARNTKKTTALNNAKSTGVKSTAVKSGQNKISQVKIAQIKAAQIKIE